MQGLAWAAAWLHSATGEQQFLADAHDYLAATQAFEGEKCVTRPLHVTGWPRPGATPGRSARAFSVRPPYTCHSCTTA